MARLSRSTEGFDFRENIKVTGIGRCHFTKSEWSSFSDAEAVSKVYLAWRGLFMGLLIVIVVNNVLASDLNFYLIYLTQWSLVTQLVYGILFFLNSVKSSCAFSDRVRDVRGRVVRETNSELESIIWILFNIVATLPMFVTLGFWLFVYDHKLHSSSLYEFHCNIILTHGGNAVLGLIDGLVVALPVRLTHSVYLIAFASTYALFSLLYEIGGGVYQYPGHNYIYPLLNWREDPYWAAVACAFALFFCCLLHCISWLNYVFRLFVVSHCSYREDKGIIYSYHNYPHKSIPTPERTQMLENKNSDNLVSFQNDKMECTEKPMEVISLY